MNIYVMRHGDAEKGNPAQPDSARHLTIDGRSEVEAVSRRAAVGGMQPDTILSSPYVRALETARIVLQTVGSHGEIIVSDTLVPHGAPDEVWNEIRSLGRDGSVLLTSHEPLVGQIAGYLLGSPGLCVAVKTGTIIRIDVESARAIPRGQLRWMITPKIS